MSHELNGAALDAVTTGTMASIIPGLAGDLDRLGLNGGEAVHLVFSAGTWNIV